MNSFWRLLRYIKNYQLNISLNIASNVLTALFTVISVPLLDSFLKILFDKVKIVTEPVEFAWNKDALQDYFNFQISQVFQNNGKEQALAIFCGIIVGTFFLKNLFRYLSLFFMAPVRNGIVRDIRKQLFDKILVLPLSFFSDERKGDLISRLTGDVQEVEWSILNVLEAVFREPLIIIGALSMMLFISPSLTVFVFILIFFTAFVIGGIGKTLKKPSAIVQEKLGSIVSVIEEALGGLRIIKGFNGERYQQEKFGKENNDYRYALTRLLWRRDLSSPMSEFLGIAVVAILLWYGSKQVFSGELDAETFLAFIYAFYMVIDPSKSLSKAFYNIQKGIAAMARVEKILDTPNPIIDKIDGIQSHHFKNKIEYKNVGFQYTKEDEVLKSINLIIPKGRTIALVGASGAGKSTFVDLLPRFYDVSKGEILIDGINIKEFSLKSLRNLMGIVTQDPVLFNDTIYNNISFGSENATEQEIIEAATVANAHEFILKTENGYQTNIGDRGTKLSGGQRQRLTIARAILKNPPILILDEATSSLDSESEKLVQEALLKVMQNRTAIVIAHRLSTIQNSDEIIVLKEGKIIERGNHQDLLKLNGTYKKLVKLQAF